MKAVPPAAAPGGERDPAWERPAPPAPAAPATPDAPRRGRRATGPRLRWWREIAYILAFYVVYSVVRNTQGSGAVSPARAFRNARQVIDFERALGLFHEETVQDWFLPWEAFIQFWNVFYGSAHFGVTGVALIWLFRRMPGRYPLWRNTLAWTTGLALIGFALYPLMPPRLLHDCGRYGACVSYGFVDTLRTVGGLWSFDSGTMQQISNQYAAMPSLHCAWALWVTLVLWPGLRSRWARALAVAHPVATVFGIVVTANHYIVDAFAGFLTLGLGYLVARGFTRLTWRQPAA